MRPRVAPARPRDAARLALILSGWKAETPWLPNLHDARQDRACLETLIRRGDVVTLRGWTGPRGFLARDGGTVHALYISPGARGRGGGRRLLDAAKASRDRLELWTFQANDSARRFYAREGFVEVEFTDGAGNDEGLPDVRLVWERGGGA